MSFNRILSFAFWLGNKWLGNLFRSLLKLHKLPLKLHKKCISDGIENMLLNIMAAGFITIIVSIIHAISVERYQEIFGYWIITLCGIAIHFVYCIIHNQYNRYITEMNSTMDRLKEQEHE